MGKQNFCITREIKCSQFLGKEWADTDYFDDLKLLKKDF